MNPHEIEESNLDNLDFSGFLPSCPNQETLIKTLNAKMPFGKYKGTPLLLLPEPYVVWFHKEGFPKGKLGEQLGLIYEIKVNGLEKLLRPLLQSDP